MIKLAGIEEVHSCTACTLHIAPCSQDIVPPDVKRGALTYTLKGGWEWDKKDLHWLHQLGDHTPTMLVPYPYWTHHTPAIPNASVEGWGVGGEGHGLPHSPVSLPVALFCFSACSPCLFACLLFARFPRT